MYRNKSFDIAEAYRKNNATAKAKHSPTKYYCVTFFLVCFFGLARQCITTKKPLDKTKQTRKNNISAHMAVVMVSKYLLGWEMTHKIILYSLHFPIISFVCLFG